MQSHLYTFKCGLSVQMLFELLYILPVNFIPSFSVKKKPELNKQTPLFVRITKFTIISSEGSLKSKVDLLSRMSQFHGTLSRTILPFPQLSLSH